MSTVNCGLTPEFAAAVQSKWDAMMAERVRTFPATADRLAVEQKEYAEAWDAADAAYRDFERLAEIRNAAHAKACATYQEFVQGWNVCPGELQTKERERLLAFNTSAPTKPRTIG